MSNNFPNTKNDLVKIIEDIDLANSVLIKARMIALDLLEQVEQQEEASGYPQASHAIVSGEKLDSSEIIS